MKGTERKEFIYKNNYIKYEYLAHKVFEFMGYDVNDLWKHVEESSIIKVPCDFIAESGIQKYCVEVKSSTQVDYPNMIYMFDSIKQLLDYSDKIGATPVMMIFSVVSIKDKEKLHSRFEKLVIFDLPLILARTQGEDIQEEVVSLLPFSVDQVYFNENEKDDFSIHSNKKQNKTKANNVDYIKKILSCKPGKEDAPRFEKNCTELLKYLYADALSLFEVHRKSNDDLYQFDMLCRIKDNTNRTFWMMLENFFNSKYIVFEYKNYEKQIKQTQIYTTEKYLYAKALRNVAVIIARNGYDKNALWATKGCLREDGKLIMLIDVEDLRHMLELKQKNEDPSIVFMDKMDELLIELEK